MRTFCLKPQCVGTMSLKVRVTTINPSQSNASFLHPLETSENLWFSDSFRDRVSSLRRRDFGTIFFLRILRHFLNSNSYAKTCVKHCNSTACFIDWGNQIFVFEGYQYSLQFFSFKTKFIERSKSPVDLIHYLLFSNLKINYTNTSLVIPPIFKLDTVSSLSIYQSIISFDILGLVKIVFTVYCCSVKQAPRSHLETKRSK